MIIEPNRRDFLNWSVQGTGATALAGLLAQDKASGSSIIPHYPAVAKRVIHRTKRFIIYDEKSQMI